MKSSAAVVQAFYPRSIPFLALALGAFFSGCASRPNAPLRYCTDGRVAPEWTTMGAAAFPGDAGRALYGRGEASHVHNRSLLRELAEHRARADLAKMLNAGVKALMTEYAATASSSGQDGSKQGGDGARRTLVNESLGGVVMVDSCEEAEEGIYFSLARLDADAFTASLDRHKNMDDKMKEYLRANVRRVFESPEKEVGQGKLP